MSQIKPLNVREWEALEGVQLPARATTHDLMDIVAEVIAKHGCAGTALDIIAAKGFIPDVPVTDVLVEGR